MESMMCFFNNLIAKQYGINCAIMLHHIKYWVLHNMDIGQHYHDGRYWTFWTLESFCNTFPFWNKDQVWRTLNKLRELDLVMTGNYNRQAFDRTLWYTLTDHGIDVCKNAYIDFAETLNQIVQNPEIRFRENATPIPYSNPYSNTDSIKASTPSGQMQRTQPQPSHDQNPSPSPSVAPTPSPKRFKPPTVEEVSTYCREHGYGIDPQAFVDHYEANGWMQGRGRPIKNWQAAVRTWVRNERKYSAERRRGSDAGRTEAEVKWLD